jgi:hypothetical protein
MNANQIVTRGFSNPESARRFRENYPDEPALQEQATFVHCGACSFFGELNEDFGLCCNAKSRHHLETVKEEFTCPSICPEGWRSHSFSEDESIHCQCDWLEGIDTQAIARLKILLSEGDDTLWALLYL